MVDILGEPREVFVRVLAQCDVSKPSWSDRHIRTLSFAGTASTMDLVCWLHFAMLCSCVLDRLRQLFPNIRCPAALASLPCTASEWERLQQHRAWSTGTSSPLGMGYHYPFEYVRGFAALRRVEQEHRYAIVVLESCCVDSLLHEQYQLFYKEYQRLYGAHARPPHDATVLKALAALGIGLDRLTSGLTQIETEGRARVVRSIADMPLRSFVKSVSRGAVFEDNASPSAVGAGPNTPRKEVKFQGKARRGTGGRRRQRK